MGLCEGMPWDPGCAVHRKAVSKLSTPGSTYRSLGSEKYVMHGGYIVILTRLTLFFEGGTYGYPLVLGPLATGRPLEVTLQPNMPTASPRPSNVIELPLFGLDPATGPTLMKNGNM